MADKTDENDKRKAHNKRHAGVKADKKAEKNKHVQEYTDKQKNPKAFTCKSAVNQRKQFLRTQSLQHRKHHIPVVDRTPLEPPPIIIAIVGGPLSGKSTLMRSLIKIYTKQRLTSIAGPVTVVSGKTRRITFVEVNNDINCMIDVAKIADIVLILIDIRHGIEMEAFEFLEICRAHGTPKIMGILNHLDVMKESKSLKKKKKAIKQRFEVELYPGAKLFYLSGLLRDEYMFNEIKNLSRFIAVSKFRPLTFRSSHPYVLVDRFEDNTNPALVQKDPKCDRSVVLFGYVRGASLNHNQEVHIPGCGDFVVEDVNFLPDPCPLPNHEKKRSLLADEQLLYAPFSGVGGVVYDKDAIYVDMGGSQHGRKVVKQHKKDEMLMHQKQFGGLNKATRHEDDEENSDSDEGGDSGVSGDEASSEEDEESPNAIMSGLQNIPEQDSVNRSIQLFSGGASVTATHASTGTAVSGLSGLPDYESIVDGSGRVRRRALIPENEDYSDDGEDDDDSDDEEEEVEDEDDSSDESDVDNLVPRTKQVLYRDDPSSEPAVKKRKIETSEDDSLKCVTDSSAQPTSMNAYSKIKLALESLEQLKHIDKSDSEDESDNDESDDDSEDDDSKRDIGSQDSNELEGDQFQAAMFEEARKNFYQQKEEHQLEEEWIYGNEDESDDDTSQQQQQQPSLFDDDDFLRPVDVPTKRSREDNQEDDDLAFEQLMDAEIRKATADVFVTGTWAENQDAKTLLELDDMDENLYGDFEDLETGEKVTADADGDAADGEDAEGEDESTVAAGGGRVNGSKNARKEKIIAKKRKLKEALLDADLVDQADYFDTLKQEKKDQAELNRHEFDTIAEEERVNLQGFRAGMYVRMKISKMPCEFVVNFDPNYPVIAGGLFESETQNVFNSTRMKVHRWFPKILKNRDPLILSIGWRRVQTMMYYGKREDDLKLRSLKYARKYMHVEGMYWGPHADAGSGFVAFQSVGQRVSHFRIAANGVMLSTDKTTQIVKKLKLIGHPRPKGIKSKTAYIQDMFHSDLEVAKFVGAKIQTQSGIRGLIKVNSGKKGEYRAKFEDKIKESDVIILKTWANVDVNKFCTVVRSLLLTPAEKQHWQGMKTVGQLKKERGIKGTPNPDSIYTEITKRRTYVPKPMKIPTSLQAALPYAYKPKHQAEVPLLDRVLIVKDEHEEKMDRFMKRVRAIARDKRQSDKVATRAKKTKFLKAKTITEACKQNSEKNRKVAACKKYSKKKINVKK